MSKLLGVNQTLELVRRLQTAVSDAVAREQKLQHALRLKLSLARHQLEDALAAEEARLAEAMAQAEAEWAARRQALEQRCQRRRARISRARHAVQRMARERIDLEEGRQKYAVQKGLLDLEKNRKAELAANDARYQQFNAQLQEAWQRFIALESQARRICRGYKRFLELLASPVELGDFAPPQDEYQGLEALQTLAATSSQTVARLGRLPGPALFKYVPVWLLGLLWAVMVGGLAFGLQWLGVPTVSYGHAALAGLVGWGLLALLYQLGRHQGQPLVRQIAQALEQARRLQAACSEQATERHAQELTRIEQQAELQRQALNQQWEAAVAEAEQRRATWPQMMEQKAAWVAAHHEELARARLQQLEQDRAAALEALRAESQARKQQLIQAAQRDQARCEAEQQTQWEPLRAEWENQLKPIYQQLESLRTEAAALFPPWEPARWADWAPPAQFAHAVQFGHLQVDVPTLAGALPQDSRLVLPGPDRFVVPLLLTHPDQGSILFETGQAGRDAALAALNNIVLRLLAVAPPGRLSFTIVDPVGLGQSFSGIMHLADYAEFLINSRIWTQPNQIEQRLAELNEHMEKVIQMYLRNEYATIVEYNEQAGNIAEKYHFLVVADFPVNFTDAAAKRLLSIATSGARCGVFTLIHWDRRQPLPQDFTIEDLRKSSVCLVSRGNQFVIAGQPEPGTQMRLESPPQPEFAIEFIHRVGLASRDSNRIEVPFVHVAPSEAEMWSLDTTAELRVPIGRTGATKLQHLAIGKGTRQHALVAGKTGSGKSTLFHVIITNLCLWCSPEQVEFYLIDFKKGVEFKCYATHQLPHARVVAIESDREFGLSVLQRVDEELKRRGELFRRWGVQDLPGYKRAGGTEPLPRTLLIIDEFQEFFVEDDKIAQTASLLLDRLVRQGRAFGIHVMLGSQTLGGAYTVARTTLGQMVIRIALQCNEADAYLIMDDSNPAPRLLSRPGEAIYNDTAGSLEGNSPFQVVWLPDDERDQWLAKVQQRAKQLGKHYPPPIVFEGNAPADVRENLELQRLLEAPQINPAAVPRIWLGAPNSIKGPTEAVFYRQSGNNLLIVGQRDEAVLAILTVGLVSLSAQYPRGAIRFVWVDSTPPGTPQRAFLDKVLQIIPHPITVPKPTELPEVMTSLAAELKQRTEDPRAGEAPPVFLFIQGLQKFGKLRYEEDFGFSTDESDKAANPGAQLNSLICDGPSLGLHTIVSCDTYNNVNRFLSKKALSEFEMRVLFQMSANDSASLIDSPRASTLGLHRALFYNEQQGYLETFRPYALPSNDWIQEAARHLARLVQ